MVEHVYHSCRFVPGFPVSLALVAFHSCARHAELDAL